MLRPLLSWGGVTYMRLRPDNELDCSWMPQRRREAEPKLKLRGLWTCCKFTPEMMSSTLRTGSTCLLSRTTSPKGEGLRRSGGHPCQIDVLGHKQILTHSAEAPASSVQIIQQPTWAGPRLLMNCKDHFLACDMTMHHTLSFWRQQ